MDLALKIMLGASIAVIAAGGLLLARLVYRLVIGRLAVRA